MSKEENNNKKEPGRQKGFYYTVTDEQIKMHQQRSVEEIFEWLEGTNKFLWDTQTLEERERMFKIRKGEY
ncbi:MAG: hypothetical protein ABIT08_10270 [Bacteroidia bacterium]